MKAEKQACFAGGCFWCIAPAFSSLPGVTKTVSGYCGGEEAHPAYEDVKAQKSLHRESVLIRYDPERITYAELVDRFLLSVDPFDGGGQFIDRGRSYTLAVYPRDEEEERIANEKIRALEQDAEEKEGKRMTARIAVERFTFFAEAEEEHQDYAEKNPEAFAQEWEASGRGRFFDGARNGKSGDQ